MSISKLTATAVLGGIIDVTEGSDAVVRFEFDHPLAGAATFPCKIGKRISLPIRSDFQYER
jgi:hypothetical protein